MRRRDLLAASAALLAVPRALAQTAGRAARIAVFTLGPGDEIGEFVRVVHARLATHGLAEGRSLHSDVHRFYSLGEASVAQIREQLTARPDTILSFTSSLTRLVQQAAGSLPVVFTLVGDAVAYGLVKDYARPGVNATGSSWRSVEMTLKRLELLRETLPRAKRIAFAGNLSDVTFRADESAIRNTAGRLGLELIDADVFTVHEAMRKGADAVFLYQPFTYVGRGSVVRGIIGAAAVLRLPVFVPESELVTHGALLSYGPDVREQLERAADLLARVLRGARPADLPVDLSDRFMLTVNLKVANALGIRVPGSVRIRADRVIE